MLENIISKKTIPADGVQRQWDIPFTFYKLSDVGFYVSYDNGKTIEKITQNIRYEKDGNYFVYPTEESKLPVLPVGATVLLLRETENKQLATSETFPFNSRDIEHMADNLTMQIQDLKRDSLRSVKSSLFSEETGEQFSERFFETASEAIASANAAKKAASDAEESKQESLLNAQNAASSAVLATSASESARESANSARNDADKAEASAQSAKKSADFAEAIMNGFDSLVYTKEEIDNKVKVIEADIDELGDQVSEIESKIPASANATNQLADKAYVDSAVAAGGGGGSSGSADVAEALRNQNEAEGAIEHLYNWVGTLAEYEAQNIATEHPEWIVLITDDDGAGSGGGGGSSNAKWGTITGDINAQTDLTNLFNDQATAIAEKQDKLTAGEGITIEDNVISATGSGGSAEIPDNVYTSDNLIAGKNVTFTEVPPEGGIDEHTLACWHCDEGTIDAVSSLELWNGAKTSSSYYKFGVASVYNVTGPILNIANSLSASSDWTIDFWAKPSSNTVIVLGRGTYSSSYQGFSGANAKIYNNRVHVYRGYSSSGQEISLSRDSSTFTHYAFQRKSEYLEFFVNGQKIIQQDVAGAGTDGNFGISLEVNIATCYFDEIRISDTARYTEDFTPPTKAYTVATGPSKTAVNAIVAVPTKTSELENDSGFLTGLPEGIYTQTNLLGGKDIEIVPEPVEGGIDEHTLGVFHCETSSYNINAVEGGGSLKGSTFSTKTEYFKFGESSLYAGNSYPYYYMSTSQIKEESDWTVDGWIRLTEWPGAKASAGCGQSGSSFSWKVEISHDNNEAYIYYQNTSTITKTSSYTIPADEWVHFAAEKDGNTINGYVNGGKIISYTDDSVKNTTSKRYPFLQVYEAYFDEIRFSNTARYKGQPFTPPTKAYSVAEPTGNMVVNFTGKAGGNGKNIGEVYYSQSSLATDNSGALPLFTGETIASANTIYPDFYAWVESHTELQTTAEEYESALSAYGECPKYVVSNGSLRLPKLANYIKMANTADGVTQKEAGLPNITGEQTALAWGTSSGVGKAGTGVFSKTTSTGGAGANTGDAYNSAKVVFDASSSNNIYGNSDTVTPAHTTLYPWVVAYTASIEASVAQTAEFQQGLSGKVDLPVGVDNSAVDYVVESYNDGANWYRVYKSGWIEQGGGVVYDKTNVTFLKPFASANITLLLTRNSSYQGGISSAHHGSWTDVPTETGFTCYCNANTSYSWRAEGKGA